MQNDLGFVKRFPKSLPKAWETFQFVLVIQ